MKHDPFIRPDEAGMLLGLIVSLGGFWVLLNLEDILRALLP